MKTIQIIMTVLAVAFLSAACDASRTAHRTVPVQQNEAAPHQVGIDEQRGAIAALEVCLTETFGND